MKEYRDLLTIIGLLGACAFMKACAPKIVASLGESVVR